MFSRCDNDNKSTAPLEAEVIPVLHSVAEANASDESERVAKQEDEQIGIFQILDKIRGSSGCLAEHKLVASTIGRKNQTESFWMSTVHKIIFF
jgi:hypothetical protein